MEHNLGPLEYLIHSTVRIVSHRSDGNVATGTGFFMVFTINDEGLERPFIVTNKHVVRDSIRVEFYITRSQDEDAYSSAKHEKFIVSQPILVPHPDDDIDLVAMDMGQQWYDSVNKGNNFLMTVLNDSKIISAEELKNLSPVEDVIMIGYPNSIWDSVNNMPVVRKGITATHPRLPWNGRPEFLIDMACFPGSSGSPVFIAGERIFKDKNGDILLSNKPYFLGILYAGPQHEAVGKINLPNSEGIESQNSPLLVTNIPNNIGYVISAKETITLQDEIKRRIKSLNLPLFYR